MDCWAGSALALVTVGLLAGCSGTQENEAASVAQRFLVAVQEQEGREACSLLAPAARAELEQSSGQACDVAILEEDLGADGAPPTVQVFDTMAQARFADDTVFLSRFDGEWLVIAAACTPVPDRPYDCTIQVS
jgi:hypothetical protein